MKILHPLQQYQFQLTMTMRLQVMSNQAKGSSESDLKGKEAENMPTISIIDFEDVDALKSKVKADIISSGMNLSEREQESSGCISDEDEPEKLASASISGGQEHIEKCVNKESSCDDTDATLSVSSDTTLEPEASESQLKANEDRMSKLALAKRRTEDGSHSSNIHKTKHVDGTKYSNIMSSPLLTDDLPVEVGDSARFSKVLENISLPLLYIPTTKQLVKHSGGLQSEKDSYCSGEPQEVQTDANFSCKQRRDYSCNGTDSISSTIDLSSSEMLDSHFPMQKAHSAQEFQSMLKCTDSDRLTLHSVDSYPGYHHNYDPNSYLFPDNSSLSSVSTGTEFSVSAVSCGEDYSLESKSLSHEVTDEAAFMDVNLHSRNSFDKGYNSSSLDSGYGDKTAPSFQAMKKKPFTGLKNLFAKRGKEESPPGWKLFGRIPPKSAAQKNAEEIKSEFQARNRKVEKPNFPLAGKKQGSDVMSTTALILENRPTNLPTKSPEEAEKHRQQYEEMVEGAKKKEQKDIKLKKKQLQQQRKLEDQMMAAARAWDTEILPNWESMKSSKKARDLWWLGLPPNVRGRVWQLAVGNDLNITHALYDICHERAEERIRFVQEQSSAVHLGSEAAAGQQEPSNKESSVKVIKLDVSRTFPHLCIFQKGGPFYDLLHNLLGAYACYRPDVGYVQGMSFIAAILLLNMDVADAFVCFANLLNRPCQLAFFRMDENLMTAYYSTFDEFFKENLPKLQSHFNSQSVTPNLYLMEWVFLLYSKSLPLDVACRVWDVFFRDGEEFLFRTALAILKLYESVLLKMDFIHIAQFLTKLPEDIGAEQLFKEVENVKMNIDKRGFHAVHVFFKDLHASNS